MQRSKWLILMFSLVMVTVFALAACGSGGTSGDPADEGTSQGDTATSEEGGSR